MVFVIWLAGVFIVAPAIMYIIPKGKRVFGLPTSFWTMVLFVLGMLLGQLTQLIF